MASNNNTVFDMLGFSTMQEDNLKKHSSLLNNSDSDSEADGKTKKPAETNTEETLVNDFFNSFHNKYAKKILGIECNN